MKHLSKWNLDNPHLIATTATAKVYKVNRENEDFVLKIFTEKGRESEGIGGEALKIFNGEGAVSLIESDEEALLMEYIEGNSLKDLKEEDAQKAFIETLGKLHKKEAQEPFDSMERRYRSLLERGSQDDFYKKGSQKAEALLKEQSVKILLHGDLHHKNILFSKERGWLGIDPQPLIGEPLYDLGNYFYNPDDCPKVTEDIKTIKRRLRNFSESLRVDEERVLDFAIVHGYLSSSWQLDDGEDPVRRLRILEQLRSLS